MDVSACWAEDIIIIIFIHDNPKLIESQMRTEPRCVVRPLVNTAVPASFPVRPLDLRLCLWAADVQIYGTKAG